jgi:hypothetical protein
MLKINKFISLVAILIVVGIAMAVPAAVQPEAKDRRGSDDSRVEAPVKLAILIQDDLVSHVSNELDITRDFIKSLPTGSEVMVGYIRSGSLQVRQPFTYDLARAAKSLRMVVSSTSASPYNPYVEVLEAAEIRLQRQES